MEIHIGLHSAYIEKDTLFSHIRGDFHPSEVEQFFRLAEQIIAEHGYFFSISDLNRMGKLPPETRRLGAEWSLDHTYAGSAFYGAPILVRTIMSLAMRGVNLFRRDNIPTAFVKTEQEARDWIETCRQQRLLMRRPQIGL